ncbi:MAG: universal stress protein [Solirubrobacteraceae bacterium]
MYTQTPIRGAGLLEISAEDRADLIVLAANHPGLVGHLVPRPQNGALVDHAPCPVVIVPDGFRAPGSLRRIGIGHNGSPESIRGLAIARALARHTQAEIEALAVVSLASIPYGEPVPERWPETAADLVEAEEERVRALVGVRGHAVYGEPGPELAKFGRTLDLLIVGSRGLSAIGRLRFGSTSRYLAHHPPCPLLVIRRGLSSVRTRPITVVDSSAA